MHTYHFRLYVAGTTSRSERARRALEELIDRFLEGQARMEVVDVRERPEVAEADRVLATPTLIKLAPIPVRRVMGDLYDCRKVLVGLSVGLELAAGGDDG